MWQPINLNAENAYEITVRGEIEASWLAGFGEVGVRAASSTGDGQQATRLTAVTDQAGLVGLIRRLHGLGVVLVAVRQASADDPAQTERR